MPDRKKRAKRAVVAEPLLDEAVRHAHDIEALKNFLVRKMNITWTREVVEKLIEALESRIPRIKNRGHLSPVQAQKNVAALIIAANEIIRAGMGAIARELSRDLRRLAVAEARQALAEIQRTTPIQIDLKSPSPQTLRSAITSKPMQGEHIPKWFKKTEATARAAVEKEIRIGLAEGKTSEQITRAIRGTRALQYRDGVIAKPRHQVETVVRTSVNHVVTDAREQAFAANSDIIEGVKIVAVLDSRTTFICISEDQNVYPVGVGPRPPLHPNCRSTTVPVLDYEKLGFNPAPGTRAALGAKGGEAVSDKLDYAAWFARQPAAWQKQTLGPGRYRLYRQGVPLDKFVNDQRRILTIEQIKQRAALN